jgi:hypothetical protein
LHGCHLLGLLGVLYPSRHHILPLLLHELLILKHLHVLDLLLVETSKLRVVILCVHQLLLSNGLLVLWHDSVLHGLNIHFLLTTMHSDHLGIIKLFLLLSLEPFVVSPLLIRFLSLLLS